MAADKAHLYAVDNGRIARYDKATGVKQAEWTGDPVRFKHLNACLIVGKDLVCAGSNYPSVPQNSAVELFDPVKMTHTRTIPLGPGIGSPDLGRPPRRVLVGDVRQLRRQGRRAGA